MFAHISKQQNKTLFKHVVSKSMMLSVLHSIYVLVALISFFKEEIQLYLDLNI